MYHEIKLKAFIKAMSILIFFITFFTNYLIYSTELFETFIKSTISLIVATIVLNLIYFVWRFTYPAEEWQIIINAGKIEANDDEATVDDTEELPESV